MTPEYVSVGEEVIVKAEVHSLDASSDGVTVLFYDKHPDKAVKAFDSEMISNIRANGHSNVRVVFQPESCGEQKLFVSAGNRGACNIGAASASVVLNVLCKPEGKPGHKDPGREP